MVPKAVALLSKLGYTDLVDSIKLSIGRQGIAIEYLKKLVKVREAEEQGADAVNAAKAKEAKLVTQKTLEDAENAAQALGTYLVHVRKEWRNFGSRTLGSILRSPPLTLGVGEERFTQDWAIFEIHRAKLGNRFKGNQIELRTFPLNLNWPFSSSNALVLPYAYRRQARLC